MILMGNSDLSGSTYNYHLSALSSVLCHGQLRLHDNRTNRKIEIIETIERIETILTLMYDDEIIIIIQSH